jgi:hypothetical protein
MSNVDWQDRPPSVPKATIWTPPNGTSLVALLGRGVGLWLHWLGRRSYPCEGKDCPAARHRKPAYWTKYFPACIPVFEGTGEKKLKGYMPVVIALSQDHYAYLEEFSEGGPILLEVARQNGDRQFRIKKVQAYHGKVQLPPVFDVRPVLYRVWGMRPPTETGSNAHPPLQANRESAFPNGTAHNDYGGSANSDLED